jgi:hypothetical protein
MNLKRPSMRTPELRAPGFLADLYYDMRDRRLLPLIALVVVAIAAVPILLGGSEPEPLPALAVDSGAAEAETASASLVVVEAKPGLRDYRKRLRNRTPTNPFKQRYTGLPESAQVEATASGSADSSGSVGATPEVGESGVTIETAPSGSSSPGRSDGGVSPGSGSAGSGDSGQRFYAYRPTIRFGPTGGDELHVYEHLSLGKLLPQEKPVLVFIGSSEDGNRVAFNLSREVTRVRGPGRCVGGKEDCGLLILHAGQAVDLLTATPGRSFRLHVVAIDFVEVDRPKPAQSSSAAQSWGFGMVVGQFGSTGS